LAPIYMVYFVYFVYFVCSVIQPDNKL